MSTYPGQVTRYHCPIGTCEWVHDAPGPTSADGVGATVDDIVFSAVASHLAGVEAVIRQHLGGHSLLEWAQEIGRLRERLTAAEEVCLLFGWTGANMGSTEEKALHELWRHWCDVSGASLSPADHPELNARRLAELAAKRDEARARTLAAIRRRDDPEAPDDPECE